MTVVIYRSKYGATKNYAQWIAEELGCECVEAKYFSARDFSKYETVIYGAGLYGNSIAGISLLTKNMDLLEGKKIIVFSTAVTPPDCREYYDGMVLDRSIPMELRGEIKVYNFLGKMILKEMSLPHRAAILSLKKVMGAKKNRTELEQMLYELCSCEGDFCDRASIAELVEYAR